MNNRKPVRRRKPISKHMVAAIRKAEKEIIEEGDKQLDIQVCSALLALNRYWGWKKDRLGKLIEIHKDVWNENASNNDVSMLQQLDIECDIELTDREGVSYRDYKFLNTAIDDGHELSPQEWVILRIKQKSWLECQVMACLLLAMHRKEGWGVKRIKELMNRMQQIKAEFDYDPKKLIKAVKEESNYDWLEERGKGDEEP